MKEMQEKKDITLRGNIEGTTYINGISYLKLKSGNHTYFIKADKKRGFIQPGEPIEVKGFLNVETMEIENPKIKWILDVQGTWEED